MAASLFRCVYSKTAAYFQGARCSSFGRKRWVHVGFARSFKAREEHGTVSAAQLRLLGMALFLPISLPRWSPKGDVVGQVVVVQIVVAR